MFAELNEWLTKMKSLQYKKEEWEGQIAKYQIELQEKRQALVNFKFNIEKDKEATKKLENFSFIRLWAVLR